MYVYEARHAWSRTDMAPPRDETCACKERVRRPPGVRIYHSNAECSTHRVADTAEAHLDGIGADRRYRSRKRLGRHTTRFRRVLAH